FSLLTYKQVAPRADAIAEVVREQRMPPWYAAPDHGTFTNRRGLTAEERETILQWVRAGTPKGDGSKVPESPCAARADRWRMGGRGRIGTPDLIVEVPFAQELPASGDVPYKYAVIPHVFEEDTWVQGVQILPDNPRVVHHCNLVYMTNEGYKQSNFITGVVPG